MTYLLTSNIALCIIGGIFLTLLLLCMVNTCGRIWQERYDESTLHETAIDHANWQEPMFYLVESAEELEERYGVAA